MHTIVDSTEFDTAYPDQRAVSTIKVDTPLISRARLVGLAQSHPAELVEFNPGDLPISVSADSIPDAGMSAPETIEKIGMVNSWMVIRNIEKDPAYRALAHGILDSLKETIERETGEMMRREAFMFISSPGAVTPFHIDEEHNILIQLEGTKTFTVYSQHDRELASQTDLENFHSGAHRNLKLNPECAGRGEAIHMEPGTALYVPPLAPHHVKVTSDVPSLSLSITWRSESSKRTCYLHQINHKLRQKGVTPKFPGESKLSDTVKIWKESAAARLNKVVSR
jgi:quercetin dioxygenase-like cupin family protein